MAILDAEPTPSVAERILALEAQSYVQRELIRALIARNAHDRVLDAPLLEAVRAVNRHLQALPADQQDAYTAALKQIDVLSIPRQKSSAV